MKIVIKIILIIISYLINNYVTFKIELYNYRLFHQFLFKKIYIIYVGYITIIIILPLYHT